MAAADPESQIERAADAGERDTLPPGDAGDSVPARGVKSSIVPDQFGRYRIERLLGQGAMGSVYLALDTQLHRKVALKVPRFGDANRDELLQRFYREARSAATLRHPNLCPVFDVGEIGGTHYITMAYIAGRPLSEFVSTETRKSDGQVATVVRKISLALDEAHRHGVIHRDLKPSNIMMDEKHDPVIMDFGLARQLTGQDDSRLTASGTIVGSPAYMSPEQVYNENEKIGPATDVYALGVILYELLTGTVPFTGTVSAVIGQIVSKEPRRPSELRGNVDPRLEAICLRMISKRIEDRFASMEAVAKALSDYLDGRPTPALPLPVSAPERTAAGSGMRSPPPLPARATPVPLISRPPLPARQQFRSIHDVPAHPISQMARFIVGAICAVAMPPVTVALYARWPDVLVNVVLTLCLWLPGVVHAFTILLNPPGSRKPVRNDPGSGARPV